MLFIVQVVLYLPALNIIHRNTNETMKTLIIILATRQAANIESSGTSGTLRIYIVLGNEV